MTNDTPILCKFCPITFFPRRCNASRQRTCGSSECKAKLKAQLQRKYLDDGYWQSDSIRLKRAGYRNKCRLKKRNPDLSTIFSNFFPAAARILDSMFPHSLEKSQDIVKELDTLLDALLSGWFKNANR